MSTGIRAPDCTLPYLPSWVDGDWYSVLMSYLETLTEKNNAIHGR